MEHNSLDPAQEQVRSIREKLADFEKLTDSRFVTYRTLLDSNAEKVALALNASDKAITKAETANEKRFEAVNEFRAQQGDLIGRFVDTKVLDAKLTGIAAERDSIRKELREVTERALHREIYDSTIKEWTTWRDSINVWRASIEGRQTGLAPVWGFAAAVGGGLLLYVVERLVK